MQNSAGQGAGLGLLASANLGSVSTGVTGIQLIRTGRKLAGLG